MKKKKGKKVGEEINQKVSYESMCQLLWHYNN